MSTYSPLSPSERSGSKPVAGVNAGHPFDVLDAMQDRLLEIGQSMDALDREREEIVTAMRVVDRLLGKPVVLRKDAQDAPEVEVGKESTSGAIYTSPEGPFHNPEDWEDEDEPTTVEPTLTDRINVGLDQHPNYTPTEMARHLGANPGSVRAIMHAIRKAKGIEPPPKPVTAKERVLECQSVHPDWTVAQIAAELDIPPSTVSARLSEAGIKLDNRGKCGPRPVEAPQKAVSAETVVEPEPQIQPAPLIPKFIPPGPRHKFYLRQERSGGKFLHTSCEGLVEGRMYAWTGTEAQLLAVRQKFPLATGMVEVPADI
jgi:hypothetical protein